MQVTVIVFAVSGKVSEYLVAPIGRQLGYLFCYRSHAEKLRNQVQTLRTTKDDKHITIDEATRKGDEIRTVVQDWLNRVDQITGEAEALMTDDQNMSCLNGWCPNLISRYHLSREAYKKAQVIVGIQTARNFPDGISYSVPPRNATFIDVSWTRDSKKYEEGIAKIQQKTAEMLGFQFKGKDESTRADELKQRLQKEKEQEKGKEQKKEKILIILDDIWKEINLERVGIPFKMIRQYAN